ncbi:MAG: anion permease, partial [Candidatus Thermoplasmatota archaeon]|nr:anion permease [Candidatus Thermoplasmatota archaeon]
MKKTNVFPTNTPRFTLSKKNILYILIAFSIIILFYFLPTPSGLTDNGKIMIGILLMSLVFWVTETIPLAVTGLLIMIAQPLFGVNSPEEVFSSFGNQALFFLLGAFILTSSLEKYGLHKRVALKLLSLFDTNPKNFTLGIMFSCAFLSFIIPEHGVAVLFMTIISSILITLKVQPKISNFGKICMLSVAYGCSIGSLGTLIGGARNPLAIGFLSNLDPPIYIGFFDWMLYSMPIVFLALPAVWLILHFSFPIEISSMKSVKQSMIDKADVNRKLSNQEFVVIGIFL